MTTDVLNVLLKADVSEVKEGLKDVINYFNIFGKTAQSSSSRASSALSEVKNVVVGLGLGQALKTSISDAMNAVESESLFETSLGNYAKSAREWSTELSNSLGLNGYALRKNLGVLYNMTTSMGLSKDAAYDMSTELVALSEDMASFYNMSSDEAFAKIRSGLTGEAEPLKALGILIDDATIKQYAYATGIAETGKELTAQEKVLARYQAILGQTANAQGDLSRTIDSPANQLRILMNDLSQASIEFGTALMPIVQAALPIMRDVIQELKPVVLDVANGISYLSSALEKFDNPAIKTIAYSAAIIGVMRKLTLSIGGPLTAILLLGTALSWLIGRFGETQESVAGVIEESANAAAAATDSAAESAGDLEEGYKGVEETAKRMLAGFDEITKLSGGSGAKFFTDADVENAEKAKEEVDGMADITTSVKNSINDIFGQEYTVDASISDIGLPSIDWGVIMTNFVNWVDAQDWEKPWQDAGNAFVNVFRTGLGVIDDLFGTQLVDMHDTITGYLKGWGASIQQTLFGDEAKQLEAREAYRQEHGETPWNTFYNMVKGEGVDIREAYSQVYTTKELQDMFKNNYINMVEYYMADEVNGLKGKDVIAYLETPGDSSSVETPVTREDIYTISQNSTAPVSLEVRNVVQLEGETVKQWIKDWLTEDVSTTNGKQ